METNWICFLLSLKYFLKNTGYNVLASNNYINKLQCVQELFASYFTCAGSLAFPGVGLRGFGVEGASPALEEPGSSFLRVGARSSPFPWGEWGGLPVGELGS